MDRTTCDERDHTGCVLSLQAMKREVVKGSGKCKCGWGGGNAACCLDAASRASPQSQSATARTKLPVSHNTGKRPPQERLRSPHEKRTASSNISSPCASSPPSCGRGSRPLPARESHSDPSSKEEFKGVHYIPQVNYPTRARWQSRWRLFLGGARTNQRGRFSRFKSKAQGARARQRPA